MVTRQRTSNRGRTGRRTDGRFARTRGRGRASNLRRGSNRNRSSSRGRASNLRRGRSTRTTRGRSRMGGRRTSTRRLPQRDSHGRFVRRRMRTAARPRRTRRARTGLGPSVVREASERSRAGPALVKRRWWRVDGPVDPRLPEGYAYER
jgi:hypothetical protein